MGRIRYYNNVVVALGECHSTVQFPPPARHEAVGYFWSTCDLHPHSPQGIVFILKHTKYCFLKNPENLTEKQKLKLSDVLKLDLKSGRAYLLKESFQLFWAYTSPYWAGWYLDKWCERAMRSRLEPMKKFVTSIRKHRPLIMNYFKAQKRFSSGVVEGMNRKVHLTTRKAYGFRTFNALETALYHNMGNLPEPKSTHEFF